MRRAYQTYNNNRLEERNQKLLNFRASAELVEDVEQKNTILKVANISQTRTITSAQRTIEVQKFLNDATFKQTTLMCEALFIAHFKLRQKDVIQKIVDNVLSNKKDINPLEQDISMIFKCLRYSKFKQAREDVVRLLSGLENKILLASPFNAIQTLKLAESYRACPKHQLDVFGDYIFKRLGDFRIKDAQYALSCLSNLVYRDLRLDQSKISILEKLCDKIVSGRYPEKFVPDHLLPLLRAFCIFGFYNDKLINYTNRLIKSPEVIAEMRKDVLELDKSINLIYVATRLEGGQEKFADADLVRQHRPIITDNNNSGTVKADGSLDHLKYMLSSSRATNDLELTRQYRKLAKDLSNTSELGGDEYRISFQYTLPYIGYSDLVISKDCKEPGDYNRKTFMPSKVPEGDRCCILIAYREFDLMDGYSSGLSGYKRLTNRLLEKLGYRCVLVNLDNYDIHHVTSQIKSALDV